MSTLPIESFLRTPAPNKLWKSAGVDNETPNVETPIKINSAITNIYSDKELETQKRLVCEDLGNQIPEVTLEFMFEHVVPSISGVDFPATVHAVESLLRSKGGWNAFRGVTPKQFATMEPATKKEDNVFAPLMDIYRTIVENTKFSETDEERQATLEFLQQPNRSPSAGSSPGMIRTKPDGVGMIHPNNDICTQSPITVSEGDHDKFSIYMKRQNDSKMGFYSWYDIAYPEEYKINDDKLALNDNIKKILWNFHQLMSADPRRRFVYGLTIENENTRIWYCCRQSVIVSKPFNFNNKDGNRHIIQLISSLAFADSSQLGYDSTMILRWTPKGSWQFKILVGSDWYETVDIILENCFNIRGRATRVWKVRSVATGKLFILKDSWCDIDRQKEGDIISTLLKNASAKEKNFFLTVIHHEVVQIDGKDDCTSNYFKNAADTDAEPSQGEPSNHGEEATAKLVPVFSRLEINAWKFLNLDIKAMHSNLPKDGIVRNKKLPKSTAVNNMFPLHHGSRARPKIDDDKPSPSASLTHYSSQPSTRDYVEYSHKLHYRILFEEVGESFQSLTRRGEGTLDTLFVVLRDITLALRFMTKRGLVHRDVSAANIIIHDGTAKLCDLEFAKEYGESPSAKVRTATHSYMSGEVMQQKYYKYPTITPFLHNPVHDLESLWWIAVWFLVSHYPIKDINKAYTNKDILQHIEILQRDRRDLFPTTKDIDARNKEIHEGGFAIRSGHIVFKELGITYMSQILEAFRELLLHAYSATAEDLPRINIRYFTDELRIWPEYPDITLYDALITLFLGVPPLPKWKFRLLASIETQLEKD